MHWFAKVAALYLVYRAFVRHRSEPGVSDMPHLMLQGLTDCSSHLKHFLEKEREADPLQIPGLRRKISCLDGMMQRWNRNIKGADVFLQESMGMEKDRRKDRLLFFRHLEHTTREAMVDCLELEDEIQIRED